MTITIPSHLTDASLMTAAAGLAGDERDVTARLVAHLVEIDRRRLYLPAGHSSMYWYCREGLGYSEDAAFNRAAAARVARRYPAAIDMLSDGRLSLTALKLLAPVLKDDNWERVFAEAAHLPKRDIEKLVACLDPKPDIPSVVRRITASALHPKSPSYRGSSTSLQNRRKPARRLRAVPRSPRSSIGRRGHSRSAPVSAPSWRRSLPSATACSSRSARRRRRSCGGSRRCSGARSPTAIPPSSSTGP